MNAQFSLQDKQFLLEKLWLVALADNRVEDMERDFINKFAQAIDLDADTIRAARWAADNKPQKGSHQRHSLGEAVSISPSRL